MSTYEIPLLDVVSSCPISAQYLSTALLHMTPEKKNFFVSLVLTPSMHARFRSDTSRNSLRSLTRDYRNLPLCDSRVDLTLEPGICPNCSNWISSPCDLRSFACLAAIADLYYTWLVERSHAFACCSLVLVVSYLVPLPNKLPLCPVFMLPAIRLRIFTLISSDFPSTLRC